MYRFWRRQEQLEPGKPLRGCATGNSIIPDVKLIPTETTEYDPINRVHSIKIETRKCPYLRVKVFDDELTALLDSGAGISVVNSLELAQKYGMKLQPTRLRVCTADNTEYKCLGYLNIPYTYKNHTRVVPTVVVPEISKPILGCNFWKSFGITPMADLGNGPEQVGEFSETTELIAFTLEPVETLPSIPTPDEDTTLDVPTLDIPEGKQEPTEETIEVEHELTEDQRRELLAVVKQFEFTCSEKLGRTNLIEHEIVLKEGAKPKNQPVYRCSPSIQKEIDSEIERFKQMGVIEECYSEWTNPLVPVRKSNGKIRVCLDSRRINAMTVKDTYPIRNMLEIFQRLERAKFFSIIDLKDAYFQIPLKEECRNFTAFRTSKGLFRFKVCPFGVTNAPFTMCRLMDKVIGFDLMPAVFVYLDDIVVASNTLEEHMKLLKEVATRLKTANLTISLEKSRFCRKQIKYLGYLLTEKGVSIDSSRIAPILDYARPKNVKDVRRLLGLAGFYQRFIRNYSRITVPITDLLKKCKKKFCWTDEAEEAFMELKSVLTSAPILANPDFTKTFTIESDASDTAVGAALVQELDGETRVIAYFSKKLSRTQRAYSSVEKECLGVLLAIENFRHYVEGSHFRVVTDARSLLWLFTIGVESGNSKLLRWALKIQSYDIQLVYRKGANNITADCLSRSINVIELASLNSKHDELIEKIKNDPQKHPDYRITDGQIYRYTTTAKADDPRFRWKLVPREEERNGLIKKEHEVAHFGADKTLHSLKRHYTWPGMIAQVKKFCRECFKCQTSKAGNQNVTPPMGAQKEFVEYPWQFVTLDYVGPLPVSGKGRHTCLLVATDVFSKFVLVQPFREAKASSLVDFVKNMIFLLFGVPEVILTDNGTQFTSKIFRNLLAEYNVTHWLTPSYHPQVNNTERVNRVITTAIRATIKQHKNWADGLQSIACAIRNAVHESTKYSPYFVVFGREMVSDGQEYRTMRDLPPTDVKNEEEQKRRKQLFENIKAQLAKAYERHKRTYNLRSNKDCPTYTAGETVLKRTFDLSDKAKGFCAKLAPKYEPAVVRRLLGKHCYELEDLTGKRLGVFYGNHLKKMHLPT